MTWLEGPAFFGLWGCLGILAYIYIGYPLSLMLIPSCRLRQCQQSSAPSRVTVVIAAHNEVDHIAATVRNKLEQSYPRELLDIVVVSDGSVDGTDEVLRALGCARVTVLRQQP